MRFAKKVSDKARQFLASKAGVTAIEYGLLASFIAVAIIAVVQLIGTNLTTTFSSVATNL